MGLFAKQQLKKQQSISADAKIEEKKPEPKPKAKIMGDLDELENL